MEVEVKLRLPDSTAHEKVLSLLSLYHTKTHNQRNTFFDGACGELSTRRAVLRLRFYENSENVKCMMCLKGKATIIDGVSRVEEDEEELDPKIGYECVANPSKLMEAVCLDYSRVLQRAKEEFQVGEEGFIGLGGFKNVRNVFEWNGVELELFRSVKVCYFPGRKVALVYIVDATISRRLEVFISSIFCSFAYHLAYNREDLTDMK
ncbi:hypothetical protein K7X08_011569 [Anisodus acutangulus]|uniref:CYTH domain-containing protein n=1 Tax=Anisodus acutangulus TaxID=402998 RepID=A0A9Q1RIN6_9SOLA|nr:hypothetical protein K7X08_011569 [Anisodus acutangulus]